MTQGRGLQFLHSPNDEHLQALCTSPCPGLFARFSAGYGRGNPYTETQITGSWEEDRRQGCTVRRKVLVWELNIVFKVLNSGEHASGSVC